MYQDEVQVSWRNKLITFSTGWSSNKYFNRHLKRDMVEHELWVANSELKA